MRSEIEGLRKALGDPSLGRMEPHVTLVPPVNVRLADLPAAFSVLRAAAASQRRPIVATLGPPATFLPQNPVLYLEVGGDLERLAQLREAVFRAPLARTLSWPWVPHVTLGDGIAEERIDAGLTALGDFTALVTFDRVVLLEERGGRTWVPVADACLEPPVVVGTGGIAVTITRGRTLDAEARAALPSAEAVLLDEDLPLDAAARPAIGYPPVKPIVLTARTEQGVAGFAAAWVDGKGAHAGVFVAEACRRQGVGSHLLAHLESAARAAGFEFPSLQAEGPPAFYESRSAWTRPATPAGASTGTPTGTPTGRSTRTRRRSSGQAS